MARVSLFEDQWWVLDVMDESEAGGGGIEMPDELLEALSAARKAEREAVDAIGAFLRDAHPGTLSGFMFVTFRL